MLNSTYMEHSFLSLSNFESQIPDASRLLQKASSCLLLKASTSDLSFLFSIFLISKFPQTPYDYGGSFRQYTVVGAS